MSGLDQRLHLLSVTEIAAVLERRRIVGRTTIRHLLSDPRSGVRALGAHYLEQARARERENRRLGQLLEVERSLAERAALVAGVDEVGMAPIAGPVVAAAVVLPAEWIPSGLDDSKRLDAATRERLDEEIRARAVGVGVGVVSERVIDRVNIYQASLLAMKLALRRLACRIDLALLDGRPPRAFPFPHRAVVRGDRRVRSIAAASIVAKVARDRLLRDAHCRWPQFGFDRHKGYMTPAHIRALREHGLSPIHRLSWPRVWEEADAMGPLYRELFERIAAADTAAQLEAAEFAFDATRASLHVSEEKLLVRLFEDRRAAVAEVGHGL